ncbi:MAG TPA: AIR carboxylase family protein [Candidatus Nanoarchaeia archaeon]|nr:AIR carboxylase family protein [Candidatus Nanoarchaeia archaeon]
MADILVLFASKGDEKAYAPACEFLDTHNVSYDFRMASAHKTPKDVEEILKKKYKVIITGAGLAAALPGVVAANVLCPVIGVPGSGNLEGLDALLAIMQMPPGIPVLTSGVDNGGEAAENAVLMLRQPERVVLVGDDGPIMKKAEDLLMKFCVAVSHAKHTDGSAVNIVFSPAKKAPQKEKGIVIHCPLVDAQDDRAEVALVLLKNTSHGLWVGLNNATNAAIGAIEILNMGGKYTEKLIEYRKEQADKVRSYSKYNGAQK